jgi:hypothetical protein
MSKPWLYLEHGDACYVKNMVIRLLPAEWAKKISLSGADAVAVGRALEARFGVEMTCQHEILAFCEQSDLAQAWVERIWADEAAQAQAGSD